MIIIVISLYFVWICSASPDRVEAWKNLTKLASDVCAWVFPSNETVLWKYYMIHGILRRTLFPLYLYTTYVWIDKSIATALYTASISVFGADSLFVYNPDAQHTMAVFATIYAHFVVTHDFPPGMYATVACAFASVVAIIEIGTWITPTAIPGMFFACFVGIMLGILRITFYVEVSKHQITNMLMK
jgi:hypothetical protein